MKPGWQDPNWNTLNPVDYKGGHLRVNKRAFRGAIRHKDTEKLVWVCSHFHTTSEYNTRHPENLKLVWETSALNCGIAAHEQWQSKKFIRGDLGLRGGRVNVLSEPFSSPDYCIISVVDKMFVAHADFNDSGERIIQVWNAREEEPPIIPRIYPDDMKNRYWVETGPDKNRWANAAWAAKERLWGLTFRSKAVSVSKVDMDVAKYVLGEFSKKAAIEVERVDGKRVFVVRDHKGKEIGRTPHRGKATKMLKEFTNV